MIHGLGTSRRIWDDTASRLSAHRRLIALDLPGFGESDSIAEGFRLDEVAEAVAEDAAVAAGGEFDLLGHSLGGAVALLASKRRPDLVRRLILQAPAGFRPRSQHLAEAVSAAAPVALRARRLIGGPLVASATARRILLWGAVADGGRLSPAQAAAMLGASRATRKLRQAAKAAIVADLTGVLESVEVPVGLIWGERDPLMPRETQELIRHCRPEAPVEVVPEAGHVAQLEQPALFSGAVERLLERMGDPITVS